MSELVLLNANVITMDPMAPARRSVAIRDGKILAVSGNDTPEGLERGNTRVIDCRGRTLLPGFHDAHCHLLSFAEGLVTLDVGQRNPVHSIPELQSRVREAALARPPGKWVKGKGYHEFDLEEKRHPTRWDLDEASPHHPVRLTHRTTHAHVLNSPALKHVGIRKDTPDPPGGLIERDLGTGEPTGLLFEMGQFLSKSIPPLDREEMERGMALANRELLSVGITSVQDASSRNDLRKWKRFLALKEAGLFLPRVNMMLGLEAFDRERLRSFSSPGNENQLRIGGVKIILDETTGRLHPSRQELQILVSKIHDSGFQLAVHAMEDDVVEAACSAIEQALHRSPRRDHRHRIEHCSVCGPGLARRISSLGIRVVTQPPFIYYHGDRYLKTVPGERRARLYPIGTLMRNGVKVAAGSDLPVAPPNPLAGIYAAVTRKTEAGNRVLPSESISPLEALSMYTAYAAESCFEEGIKGSITPGKLADLVLLDADPTTIPPEQIKDVKVEMTVLNGEVVWQKNS